MFKNCKNCDKKSGCTFNMIALVLVLVGAVNWGLVGAGYFFGTNLNLVNMLLKSLPWLEHAVYILVGLSAIGVVVGCNCNKCAEGVCCACDTKEEKKPEEAMHSQGEQQV